MQTAAGGEFLSPPGNISCEVDYHRVGLTEVYCQTVTPARSVTMGAGGEYKTCTGEFVIAHAGAALPVIADRVAAFTMVLTDVDSAADVIPDLARLHYDLAGFPVPRQLDAILAVTTLEHLHYGSDYPFTPEFVVEMGARALANAGSVASALAGNTRQLFPGLAAE
jgi:hypothetical protein